MTNIISTTSTDEYEAKAFFDIFLHRRWELSKYFAIAVVQKKPVLRLRVSGGGRRKAIKLLETHEGGYVYYLDNDGFLIQEFTVTRRAREINLQTWKNGGISSNDVRKLDQKIKENLEEARSYTPPLKRW